MNDQFLEFLAKERQQDIEEEFKRIHLSRSSRSSGEGVLKKITLSFSVIGLVGLTYFLW